MSALRADSIGDLIDPGQRSERRYSRRPFPPYRYVPGVHPHPLRDPAGHSFAPTPSLNRHPPWSPQGWELLDDWLYGVDLFNWFYFWEAHEVWEGLWAVIERGSAPSLMLQGLIQIAAALLKIHLRVPAGARILSAEGLEKLGRAAGMHSDLMGLDLERTLRELSAYFAPIGSGRLPPIGAEVPLLHLRRP